jgi:lipopolysaccharide export system permease protein
LVAGGEDVDVGHAQQQARAVILDRYLLRIAAGWYATVVAVIVFLLSVETLPSLLGRLSGVNHPGPVIFRSLVSLIPEYVGVGLPLAVFYATALAFRRLALAGELDVLGAVGLSSARLMRVPILIGLATCLLLIGIRGFVQPAGERHLDAIGRSVSAGEFGFALQPRIENRLGPSMSLYFDRAGSAGNQLHGIIIDSGTTAIAARRATLASGIGDQLNFALSDGSIVWRKNDRLYHAVKFRTFRLAVQTTVPKPRRSTAARDRLERLDFGDLVPLAAQAERGLTAEMGVASASARISGALFCLILPVFGMVLGVPPKRSRSAIGLGAGVVAIVLFWRASALIEDHFVAIAPAAHAGLVAAFALAAFLLLRFQQRAGPGAVEAAFVRALQSLRSLLPARGQLHSPFVARSSPVS